MTRFSHFDKKHRTTRYKRRSFTGAGDSVVMADMRVVGRELVALPAGTFDAFKVKTHSFNTGNGYNVRSEAVLWIDAASSKMVASETRSWGTSGNMLTDARVELMAYQNAAR